MFWLLAGAFWLKVETRGLAGYFRGSPPGPALERPKRARNGAGIKRSDTVFSLQFAVHSPQELLRGFS